MEPFVLKNQEPEIYMLEPWGARDSRITAGFTGRKGGVSSFPYASLNLAFHVGDDPADVIRNREAVAGALGYSLQDWTCGEQVHRAEAAVVTAADKGRGSLNRASAFADTDALVTDVPGVLLTSFYADCVPLYFFDPDRPAVGLAHAGWKGTVAEIAAAVVKRMGEAYGTRPERLLAAIGPSIGECCYEVDERVMSEVRRVLEGMDEERIGGVPVARGTGGGKSVLNLKELNRRIMIKAGILPTHIECTTWCTSCNHDVFFSYRKDGGTTGRMASFVGLKES